MKKAILIVLTIGVCIALIVAVKKQRDQLGELTAEQAQVLAQLATPVEASMSVAPANDQSASQVAHSPSMELLKLRAEGARLGNRKRELANVPAESERLQGQVSPRGTNAPGVFVLPPGYIKKSEAKFVGYNTPEETIQSLLWAIQNRDAAKFLEAYDSKKAKQVEARMQSRDSIEEFFKEADSLPGMHILGREAGEDGQVVLKVAIMPGDELQAAQIHFTQIGGKWKIASGF